MYGSDLYGPIINWLVAVVCLWVGDDFAGLQVSDWYLTESINVYKPLEGDFAWCWLISLDDLTVACSWSVTLSLFFLWIAPLEANLFLLVSENKNKQIISNSQISNIDKFFEQLKHYIMEMKQSSI